MHNTHSFCAVILFIDTHYTEGHSHTLIVHIVAHSIFPQYLRTRFTTTITSVLITTTEVSMLMSYLPYLADTSYVVLLYLGNYLIQF
jgi:hypothetical protein